MNQNKNPRILQLYLYIVFGVLLSFIAVSSINFAIYNVKKSIINQEIAFNQLVNERNTLLITTVAILKTLHVIASDPTGASNHSSIFSQDRQTYYTLLLANSSNRLQSTNEQFMSMAERQGGPLGANVQGNLYQGIWLDFVSGMYNMYQEANPFDYGIQLLTADISQINLT